MTGDILVIIIIIIIHCYIVHESLEYICVCMYKIIHYFSCVGMEGTSP